jgi:hypothetical protein
MVMVSLIGLGLGLGLMLSLVLNASSLRQRLTHECCINEGASQSYVDENVVSLLSIPTMGEGQVGQDPTMSTIVQPKMVVGKI